MLIIHVGLPITSLLFFLGGGGGGGGGGRAKCLSYRHLCVQVGIRKINFQRSALRPACDIIQLVSLILVFCRLDQGHY